MDDEGYGFTPSIPPIRLESSGHACSMDCITTSPKSAGMVLLASGPCNTLAGDGVGKNQWFMPSGNLQKLPKLPRTNWITFFWRGTAFGLREGGHLPPRRLAYGTNPTKRFHYQKLITKVISSQVRALENRPPTRHGHITAPVFRWKQPLLPGCFQFLAM